MMKSYLFVLCAIVLFTIIDAKPYRGDGGGGGGGYDGQGGGSGYSDGNGGQGRGSGGYGGGNGAHEGGDGGGHRRNDYYDYDYGNMYKPCSGRGCKVNYIGNGRRNTNTVYMYD